MRQLEASLGQALFERKAKQLVLTAAGRQALDYAETIFKAGDELLDVMHRGAAGTRQVLRVGAVATLSRNFQLDFLRPMLNRPDVSIVLRSGGLRELLALFATHAVDVVLANTPVPRDAESPLHSHLLRKQPVSLVGVKALRPRRFAFPESLRDMPVLVPSTESNVRAAFDLLMDKAGVRPRIAAEVDDMAMLRLLARVGDGAALVPTVVVQDELREGVLSVWHTFRDVHEAFYAITPQRQFPNALVRELVKGA